MERTPGTSVSSAGGNVLCRVIAAYLNIIDYLLNTYSTPFIVNNYVLNTCSSGQAQGIQRVIFVTSVPCSIIISTLHCWFQGFPGGLAVKNPAAMQKTQVWSLGLEDPLKEEITTRSIQYSCLGKSMDRGAWRATVHGDHKESDSTEWLNNNKCQFQNKETEALGSDGVQFPSYLTVFLPNLELFIETSVSTGVYGFCFP